MAWDAEFSADLTTPHQSSWPRFSPQAPPDHPVKSGFEVLPYEPGYERIGLDAENIELAVLGIIPLSLAKRLRVVVFQNLWTADGQVVSIAVSDPSNIETLDDLRLSLPGADVRVFVANPSLIDAAISRWEYLIAQESQSEVVRELAGEEEDVVEEDAEEDGKMATLVNNLLDQAADLGASDVHLESTRAGTSARLRIDGVLTPFQTYPRRLSAAIINRVKVLAELKIEERRVPQDGRFSRQRSGRTLDCRVSTLPTGAAEEAIIRIFDQGRSRLSLSEIGFSDRLVTSLEQVLTNTPHGLFLATGPTGSGKTTTLHAALELVALPERKTLTIEDPIEIKSEGISQVQVNVGANLTFATALRSFLRSDPDVILVGEIRDRETAELAIEAAMTGHLVLSSLHTNGAADAASRLLELGVEPYLLASCLRAVVAQRLVRKLCSNCRRPWSPISDDFEAAGWPESVERPKQLFRADGCPSCRHTGYRGRLAIGELVVVSEELAEAISSRASLQEVQRMARSQGTVTLREEAYLRAASGTLSLDEMHRAGL